jgi:Protein of unknown function (DUF1552)
MSVKNRPITRRTVLRGLGAMVGLPLLDAMRPASAIAGGTAGDDRPPVRMACLFWPNGCNPRTWTPTGHGKDFAFSPILQPMARHRDDVLILTHLSNRGTFTGDGHYVKDAAWLTGTTIHRTTGSDLNAGGISLDQLAAKRIGVLTPIPSLELGVEPVTTGVDTNVGYTRLYGSHISWSSPTTPVAREINPKLAFDRLFRSNTGTSLSAGRDDDRSVLDLVADDVQALRDRVGQDDRRKLDEYLDSVRAVEKRISFEASDRRARYRDDAQARKDIATLGGRVDTYNHDPGRLRQRSMNHTEHCRLMLDIILLAFQTDSTRIATFMFGNSVSNKNFSFVEGVRGGHHQLSHHENNPKKLDQYQRITTWHIEQCAQLLDRMKHIREGEGTLLDHSMVLIGSALRDGNEHDPHDLPTVLAGRAGGRLVPGRHLDYGKDTPLCNLYVSMLDRVGAPVPRFADSTGPLEGLDNPKYTGRSTG